jgi:hypothetical protein
MNADSDASLRPRAREARERCSGRQLKGRSALARALCAGTLPPPLMALVPAPSAGLHQRHNFEPKLTPILFKIDKD